MKSRSLTIRLDSDLERELVSIPRSERLGALTEDRQVGVIGKQAIAAAACDLPSDAQAHAGA